jgi:pilus assembly protein FimV
MDFSIETFGDPDDSTANADDNFTSDETMDFGIIELDEPVDTAAKVSAEPEDSNVLDFESDIDMDLDLEDLEFPEVEGTTTEEIAVTDLDLEGELVGADDPFAEFDSSQLEVESDELISDASTEDLDATVVLDQAFEPDFSSQLNEIGEDSDFGGEIDTMLDLAKAYIDMGDSDSATSALNEIISAGNDVQKSEAQNLLNQLS